MEKLNTSMVWPSLVSRTAKEENRNNSPDRPWTHGANVGPSPSRRRQSYSLKLKSVILMRLIELLPLVIFVPTAVGYRHYKQFKTSNYLPPLFSVILLFPCSFLYRLSFETILPKSREREVEVIMQAHQRQHNRKVCRISVKFCRSLTAAVRPELRRSEEVSLM